MRGYFHIILLKLNCEVTKRGKMVHGEREKNRKEQKRMSWKSLFAKEK